MPQTILLVDDYEDSVDLYQSYLTFQGYQVLTARNGFDAIVLAETKRPDIILLDEQMPGISGTEVMRRLRATRMTGAAPIVAFTAHALQWERARLLDAGFDEVVIKPCLPAELEAVVQRLIGEETSSSLAQN